MWNAENGYLRIFDSIYNGRVMTGICPMIIREDMMMTDLIHSLILALPYVSGVYNLKDILLVGRLFRNYS